jgi:uncharacterized membrane protein
MATNLSSSPLSKGQSASISLEKGDDSSTLVASLHQGPLPPPEVLAGYDRVLPGLAKEIVDMAKQEQKHRHRINLLHWGTNSSGQIFGFFLGLLGIGGAIYLLANDKAITGLGMFVGSLGSLVAAFYYSRRPSQAAQRKL